MLRKPILMAATMAAIVCAPMTVPAADLGYYQPCRNIRLTCASFEPNWSFVMPGNGTIRFLDPENPNNPANPGVPTPLVAPVCASRTSGNQINITTGAPLSLTATVTQQTCNDASGQVRPRTITYSYRQGALLGSSGALLSGTACCW